MVANIGHSGAPNLCEMVFDDLRAVNLPGADLVFFDARFSADDYEIAVRSNDGSYTPFLPFLNAQFQDANFTNSCGGQLFGVEIELDQFGLPLGAVVDAIRFRGLSNEADPIMAGVLNGGTACLDPLSAGCAGSGGFTPHLSIVTCATAGQPFSMSLAGGLGGSSAIFVFGVGASSTPLPGCMLDVGPFFPMTLTIPLGGFGPGNGQFTITTTIPPTVTPGTVGIQVFVLDPSAALGASSTPGYIFTLT